MATDPKAEAATALRRFGFGPRSGAIAAIASDPRGAVLAELSRPGAGRITDQDLLSTGEAARAAFDFRQERKAARLADRAEREAAKNAPDNATANAAGSDPANRTPATAPQAQNAAPAQNATPPANAAKPNPGVPQQIFLEEAKARIDAAMGAE